MSKILEGLKYSESHEWVKVEGGVAVVGGLTSSTFVTLFFIPVLYSLVMKEKGVKKSKIQLLLTEEK